MSKTVYEVDEERKLKYKTRNNKYSDFEIGTRVRNICIAQDHYFFYGDEIGTVIKNRNRYLGILVKFDKPIKYKNGTIIKSFNFEPSDLLILNSKTHLSSVFESLLCDPEGEISIQASKKDKEILKKAIEELSNFEYELERLLKKLLEN